MLPFFQLIDRVYCNFIKYFSIAANYLKYCHRIHVSVRFKPRPDDIVPYNIIILCRQQCCLSRRIIQMHYRLLLLYSSVCSRDCEKYCYVYFELDIPQNIIARILNSVLEKIKIIYRVEPPLSNVRKNIS